MSKLIRITDVAYNHLKQSIERNADSNVMDMQTTASTLITTYLNARIRWNEERGLFELYGGRFIDLEKYLQSNSALREPLIDSLIKMADLVTWKKFLEILAKIKKE